MKINSKNIFCRVFTGLILILSVVSCQKAPINGDLDGQWQVMEVTPEAPEIIIPERLYYAFSLQNCQLTYYGGVFTSGILTYNKGEDSFIIDFPHANSQESIATLEQYGIYSNPVVFKIEFLDKQKLILKDGEVRVVLRKF